MKFGSIQYLTKEGCKNIRTNRLMSFASIAVLTSCLILIGCSAMLFLNINNMLENVEAQNIVMVFIDDGLTQAEQDDIGTQISQLDNVKSSQYVSKEESFKDQLKGLGKDAELLKGLDENPLPNAFKVTLKDMSKFDETVASVKQIKNILSIRENSKLANQLTKIRSTVTYISIGITAMLLLVSLFIIANTVRVTMFNRRLEINIMKAVGATNWFIRWPFIIEGVILGVISGLLSVLLVFGIYSLALNSFTDVISILGSGAVPFSHYAGYMLLIFIAVGVVAGAGGSIVSMNKYLKVQGSVVSE